jgi:hypothetical protein
LAGALTGPPPTGAGWTLLFSAAWQANSATPAIAPAAAMRPTSFSKPRRELAAEDDFA